MQKSRPLDALQRIMTTFKHFEKKLDKLQEDVNSHGQTLSELRALVTNLSTGTIASVDGRSEDKRTPKKTAAIQYEIRTLEKTLLDDPLKSKKKNAIQPLPTKLKPKGFEKSKMPHTSPFQIHVTKLETASKGIGSKHAQRHRKAEALRKATTVRAQKSLEKKLSKLTK